MIFFVKLKEVLYNVHNFSNLFVLNVLLYSVFHSHKILKCLKYYLKVKTFTLHDRPLTLKLIVVNVRLQQTLTLFHMTDQLI